MALLYPSWATGRSISCRQYKGYALVYRLPDLTALVTGVHGRAQVPCRYSFGWHLVLLDSAVIEQRGSAWSSWSDYYPPSAKYAFRVSLQKT